jgi:hypothetical protein
MGYRGGGLVPINRDKRSVGHAKTPSTKLPAVRRTILVFFIAFAPFRATRVRRAVGCMII